MPSHTPRSARAACKGPNFNGKFHGLTKRHGAVKPSRLSWLCYRSICDSSAARYSLPASCLSTRQDKTCSDTGPLQGRKLDSTNDSYDAHVKHYSLRMNNKSADGSFAIGACKMFEIVGSRCRAMGTFRSLIAMVIRN